jgi:hypothetical protein
VRIRVTGYFTPEPDEEDPSSPTGVTEEAYDRLFNGDGGPPLSVIDLEELDIKAVR